MELQLNMSLYRAPVRCIRAHGSAVRAKWCASLLLRTTACSPNQMHTGESRGGPHVMSLSQISSRMDAICCNGTPPGDMETAGAAIGALAILDPYTLLRHFIGTATNNDPFPWASALAILANLGLSHEGIDDEGLEAFGFSWQEREQLRLATGEYREVPWTMPAIKDHFAHISQKDQGLIAYTPSAEKGESDVQSIIKAGRYLKKFYPGLTAVEIERLQAMVFKEDEIKFTTDPDEIERVYTNGPQSCMSGDASRWGGKLIMHPARPYGNADLALAYMTNKVGRCVARAIVWPEKKVFVKSYGDPRLYEGLCRLGYQVGGQWCFHGAKIRRIQNGRKDQVVCPHIDANQRFSIVDDDFLMIDQRGPYHPPAGGAGYMGLPALLNCGCGCGWKGSTDNMYLLNRHDVGQRQYWNGDCVEREARRDSSRIGVCNYSGEYCTKDQLVEVLHNHRGMIRTFARYQAGRFAILCGDGKYYLGPASSQEFQFVKDRLGIHWERRSYDAQLKTHRQLEDGKWVQRESTAA